MSHINNACIDGARISSACEIVAVSPRTLQRWRCDGEVKSDGRKESAQRREPSNKLSQEERKQILIIANLPEFEDKSANQIVPILADRGEYIGSESTFYRVLREAGQLTHRGKAKAPTKKRPTQLKADGPNQLWSWDITYLPTTLKGTFFYLYLIMDIYSRKIVGWDIYDNESAQHASVIFHKTYMREGVAGDSLTLHSDNGSPMKGAAMLATLQRLGVAQSLSRPSVSNDNPYSESLFKTIKYRPDFPDKPFETIEEAREWVNRFERWYNEEHRHSALRFVTPAQRHRGEDIDILQARKATYYKAKNRHPERWSGSTRNWEPEREVYLNPNKSSKREGDITKKAA